MELHFKIFQYNDYCYIYHIFIIINIMIFITFILWVIQIRLVYFVTFFKIKNQKYLNKMISFLLFMI